MPQIPSEFVQTVMPQGQEAQIQGVQASPQDFGSQVGHALDQAGNMIEQHAAQRQQLQNETNVNDVYANQFSPAARDIYQSYMKLEGKEAEARFPEFQQQMNDLRMQIRSSLPNAMQQKAFDEASTRRTEMDLDGMARYGAAQTKAWEWNTHSAVKADLVSEAEANWNNPQRLQNVVDRLDNETIDYGSKHGWSPEVFQYQRGQNQDQLWSAVIKRQAIQGDPTGAMKTYQDQVSAGRISGQAQGELEKFFKPIQDYTNAQTAYGKVTGGATAQAIGAEAQRQGVDPSTALTIWSAEGGVTNPAAKNPKSSATGIFQHLDSTWQELGGTDQDRLDASRQIQLGVALTRQNTQALTKDLGRQPQPWEVYLAHQQGIGGAEALLHADPNASAISVLGGSTDRLTLNGIPANATAAQALNIIKGDVDRHSQMYTPDGNPSPRNIAQNYEQHIAQLADQARIDNPGDPTAPERYRQHYAQQVGPLLHAQQITQQANQRIVDNSLAGPNAIKSWPEFTSDPIRVEAYSAAFKNDPSIYDRVNKAISTNAMVAWDPPETQESINLYNQMDGMSVARPDEFAKMDLMPYLGAMPASKLDDLRKTQQGIQDSNQRESDKQAKLTAALTAIKSLEKQAAMAPESPYYRMDADSGLPAGQKQYNDFVAKFGNAIDTWLQNNNGKVPSDMDIRGIARDILFPPQIPAKQSVSETKNIEATVKPPQNIAQNIPTSPENSATPGTSQAQPPIDFGKLAPENRDDFSRAVAAELQASGKLVNDDSIAKAKNIAIALHPGIEQQFTKQKTQKTGE